MGEEGAGEEEHEGRDVRPDRSVVDIDPRNLRVQWEPLAVAAHVRRPSEVSVYRDRYLRGTQVPVARNVPPLDDPSLGGLMLGLSHDEQRGEDNDGQGNRPYAKVVEVPRGELLVLGKAASTRLAALCGDLLRHPTFGAPLRVEYLCCPA